jgi:hypothetical protein
VIEVRTQEQLEKALKKTNNGADELIICLGGGHFTLRENSTATLRGNSTATLRGNSTATLLENSTATLRENSTATLRGNSTATLRENSTATLLENSTGRVDATPHSHVRRHPRSTAKINGGVILDLFVPKSASEWCDFYGVEIRKGGRFSKALAGQDVAILFKALSEDFTSPHGVSYEPGTAPAASDWDGGSLECGCGLHFSPHPEMAREFHEDAERFVACPVLVSEIAIHPDGTFPQKVKAPRVCAPCWEVDRNGEAVSS